MEAIQYGDAKQMFDLLFAGKGLRARFGKEARWLGTGAEELGVPDTVDQPAFVNLLGGCSVDGTRWAENWRSPKRLAGWHFEVTAPKSLSSLWGISSGHVRNDLEGAHQTGIESMLRKIESLAKSAHPGEDAKCLFAAPRYGSSPQ